MKSIKKNRFQKSKRQTIKKRSNRNKKLKRRRTRKRNKIYGGTFHKDNAGNTDLHLAVIKGDNQEVQNLISEEDNIFFLNHQNEEGNTALHLAVQNNNKEIVKSLIDKGADINLQNNDNNTALHLAIINSDEKQLGERRELYRNIISPILKNNMVDLNLKNNNHDTPLHLVIKYYDKNIDSLKENDIFYRKVIQHILKRENFQFTQNKDGNSPLHLIVDMLKKKLTRNVTSKQNSEMYDIIKDSVLNYLINNNNKNEILSMKNEDGQTAYQILQTAPDIVKGSGLPFNYKDLIKINPDADVMTPNSRVRSHVRPQEQRRSFDPNSNLVNPLRINKSNTKQPFRQTRIS